ncbi:hypothetical protein PRABACTJOHN_04372 [Parabacteroides johnsonii DSM 18315]|uniref:Uncharacterized protein n=1 Tax=Parabacteroides johnsonii DSM 18315 TaxID=537006 RepID=B7BH23_9BACT|nr:hypothetical protein PRABACTJOHN_04372 [Parabacteroides johnsonii DSM 18315]
MLKHTISPIERTNFVLVYISILYPNTCFLKNITPAGNLKYMG